MAEKKGKSALGKGIGALLNKVEVDENLIRETHESVLEIPVGDINPNREQPRKNFDEESLAELAQSIREHGIIQPLIVTKKAKDNYEIVAGERRWRAARLAGLDKVPVIVRELAEDRIFTLALIENLQREDLDPIETAMALQDLIEKKNLTQHDLAEMIGKSRSAIANTLRLLNLPPEVRQEIVRGEISEGHGRALLALETKEEILACLDEVISHNLSVRETEALVQRRQRQGEKPVSPAPKKDRLRQLTLKRIESLLRDEFMTQVKITDRGGRGVIQVHYASNEDLERILSLFQLEEEI